MQRTPDTFDFSGLPHLNKQGPHVILTVKEGAGIVTVATDRQGLRYGVVVSHQSQHPLLQILPYEGAATSVGANVRDVCSLGAEVIAVADSLRFGDINRPETHWVHAGVVSGVAGYSNSLGIPTIAGDLYYDVGYNENCLATVVTLGVVREDHIIHPLASEKTDQCVFILVGKPINNDGASSATVIPEPDAFLQRHLLKANYALFNILNNEGLLSQVSFLPAGNVCAKTPERFMWVVPPHLVDKVLQHYNILFALPHVAEGACAAVVDKINTSCEKKAMDANVVEVAKKKSTPGEPSIAIADFNQTLLALLAHENIAARTPLIETYDKQIQGRTLIEAGSADAGVLQPFNEDKYPEEIRHVGVALSLDQNPRYNKMDAYWGAVNAVIESVRNIAAVGATPIALTKCLCVGNPETSEQMTEFVDSVRGIIEACAVMTLKEHPQHTLPVIAGSVSFYNELLQGAIPPSPIISCIGVIPDVKQVMTYDLKRLETTLILIGERKDECGGSVYYQLHDELGANVPKPDLTMIAKEIYTLHHAIQQKLILSAHDISEGGLAVALAEMSFKNNIGVDVTVQGDLANEIKLFGETGGFILEVARDKVKEVKKLFEDQQIPLFVIGQTTLAPKLKMNGVIDIAIGDAKHAWENGLREKL